MRQNNIVFSPYLFKFCKLLKCILFICGFIVVLAATLSKGSLPGPYPETPEEKAAAAKKYNMIVEDYKPYPDNGEG